MHAIPVCALLLLLSACAGTPAHRALPFAAQVADRNPDVARCARLIADVDDAIDRTGVRDGATHRLAGYPYWRADRLLVAARPLVSKADVKHWLRAHDREARIFEIENLPQGNRQSLVQTYTEIGSESLLDEEVERCAELLSARQATLPDKIEVPDDYQTWKRVLGLYALARIPFSAGVRGYQRDTERVFATPSEALPVRGTLRRVSLALDAGEEAVNVDPRVRELFVRHAPILEIDTTSRDDQVGKVILAARGEPAIDTTVPTAYVRGSHAILGGKVLTQLIYSFWFPSRPKTGTIDLLGGKLDGLTWRVTLAPNGDALLYDTIHNCGCYHQFFPTPAMREKAKPKGLDEWAFVPQRLPSVSGAQRVVLRIESGTHYLQRVQVAEVAAEAEDGYRFMHDDALRSLPLPEGGRRSLFQPDGIVKGSERGERYLFWPMGVREPGAMRQWGRHATAFVGRRHFDDPLLLDQYFAADSRALLGMGTEVNWRNIEER